MIAGPASTNLPNPLSCKNSLSPICIIPMHRVRITHKSILKPDPVYSFSNRIIQFRRNIYSFKIFNVCYNVFVYSDAWRGWERERERESRNRCKLWRQHDAVFQSLNVSGLLYSWFIKSKLLNFCIIARVLQNCTTACTLPNRTREREREKFHTITLVNGF